LARATRRWHAKKQLYEEVLTQLIDTLGPLQTTAGALADCDALAALSERAGALDWYGPSSPLSRAYHRGWAHPVVERFADAPFVPNDLRLDSARRMLIINPVPNMGGKSTYMRARRHSLPCSHTSAATCPPERAVLGPLDRIFTRSGRRTIWRAALDLHGGNDRGANIPATTHLQQPHPAR